MKHLFYVFLGVLFLNYANTNAQDSIPENSFSIKMQLRPRAEFRDGNFRPLSKNEDPAILINNRLRLNLNYAYEDKLVTNLTMQNINIWGEANQIQTLNEVNNNFGVFEAWADLKIYNHLRTRVGRQIISLDDQRLFSVIDWGPSARTHDALGIYTKTSDLMIHSFFAFNQNYTSLYQGNLNNPSGHLYTPENAQSYKHLELLNLNYQIAKASNLNFIFTNVGFQNADSTDDIQKNKNTNLQTTGIHYTWQKNKSKVELSGYYQFGENKTQQTVSAYLLSLGYKHLISNDFLLAFRSDYLSGNSSQTETKDHAFNTLYGSGHKFYGHMDYFPFGQYGLSNNVIAGSYAISNKYLINASAHYFLSPKKFKISNHQYKQDLGQEIDLDFHYKPYKFADLSIGYSIYISNENIAALKAVNNAQPLQQWAWISLNVTPEIFKTKF